MMGNQATEDELPESDYTEYEDELDDLFDLDDEYDTAAEEIENKRWNRKPKKGYFED